MFFTCAVTFTIPTRFPSFTMKTFRGGSMYENLHLDTDKILACLYVLGFTELINFELDQGPDLQWIMDC